MYLDRGTDQCKAVMKTGMDLQVQGEVNFLPSRWGVTRQVVQVWRYVFWKPKLPVTEACVTARLQLDVSDDLIWETHGVCVM